MTESAILAEPATAAPSGRGRLLRAALMADAACRLGARACWLLAWHRLRLRAGIPARLLADAPTMPGRLLPRDLPRRGLSGDAAALAAAADATVPGHWHGPFPAGAPALALDLFAPGDIRTVWEANRLLALPLLARAARLDPAGGHLERAEALLSDWRTANPAFRGPAWACGQEAAIRALHLCLALALLEADFHPAPAMRALLLAHARRIAATRAYAAAQDNNHAVSEPAGLFVTALVLGDGAMAERSAFDLARAVARLVAPDGSFAQPSPSYHRMLLDTLSLAEWFRRRHGASPFASPFTARARAATAWLAQVMEPATGALPRCGPVDGSHLADLTLHGPDDARGSLARARGLFAPDEPPRAELQPLSWHSEGWFGARNPRFRLLMRSGAPMRFRPGQADLLHLDLSLDGTPLLIDGGTGAYNPPSGCAWWTDALAGTAGHNTIEFDGQDQMPRVGRFLHARWPRCQALPDGAAMRDHRGRTHRRHVRIAPRAVVVEDEVGGVFGQVALRWRLAPGAWELTTIGVTGPRARITVTANAPCRIRLAQGWHSPAYGSVAPAPVLEVVAARPVSRLITLVEAT